MIAVANATNGIELALQALEIGVGDEVLVPAYTFPAAPNSVLARGGTPVFVDIDSKSLNIDLKLIRESITSRTKAIIVVHAFGLCLDKYMLEAIRTDFNLPIIEDAACALGARFADGTLAGTLGDFSVFSFHQRKIINTGEGGAVVVSKGQDFQRVQRLRSHGMRFGSYFGTFEEPGFNYRWNEIAATVGIYGLELLDDEIDRRNQIAGRYVAAFSGHASLDLSAAQVDDFRTFQSFTLRFPGCVNVEQVIQDFREMGIESTIGTYHLPGEPAFAPYIGSKAYPQSQQAFNEVVAIPIYGNMTEREIMLVISATLKVAEKSKDNA